MAKLLITLLALIGVAAAEPYIPASYASAYNSYAYPSWAGLAPEVVLPYSYASGFPGIPSAYTAFAPAAVAPVAPVAPAAAYTALPAAAPAYPAYPFSAGYQSAIAEYIYGPFRK